MSWLAGALEALERELAEREVRKRQSLLDSLQVRDRDLREQQQKQQAEIQRETLRALEEQRAAAAAKSRMDRAASIANVLSPDANIDEETANALREGGLGALINKQPEQQVQLGGGSLGMGFGGPVTLPASTAFRGTAKQLEEQRVRQQRAAYIRSLPANSPVRQFLEAQDATGDNSLPATIFTPPKEDKPQVGSFEDFVVRKFGPNPTPQQIAQARREYGDAGRAPSVTVQMGGMNPAQVSAAMKLADDYRTDSKDFISRSESYGTVQAAAKDPSAAGDLSMIFAYMKMLDPGSVVREGEFATAQNTAGVPDRVRNVYNKALRGERLSPRQRADFLSQARNIYSTAQTRQAKIRKTYEDRARRFGIPAEHVVMDYGAIEEPQTGSGAQPDLIFDPVTGTFKKPGG
jgi:hypothetical protein